MRGAKGQFLPFLPRPAGGSMANQLANKLAGSEKSIYDLHTGIRSYVKDIHGIWLKDTLMNFGLGLLNNDQWRAVQRLTTDAGLDGALAGAVDSVSLSKFKKPRRDEVKANIKEMKREMSRSRLGLVTKILAGGWQGHHTDLAAAKGGPAERLEFGSHDPQWLGVRHDTFIPQDKVKRADKFSESRLHVVEVRGDAVNTIKNLEIAEAILQTTKDDRTIAAELEVEEVRVQRIRSIL